MWSLDLSPSPQKTIQYSLRLYLLFHSTFSRTSFFKLSKRPSWEAEVIKRFETAIGHLSLTR